MYVRCDLFAEISIDRIRRLGISIWDLISERHSDTQLVYLQPTMIATIEYSPTREGEKKRFKIKLKFKSHDSL